MVTIKLFLIFLLTLGRVLSSLRGEVGDTKPGKNPMRSLFEEIEGDDQTGTTFTPTTKDELQAAVDLWCVDKSSAMSEFGDINTWDTRLIEDFSGLFQDKESFNDPIGSWDTSGATTMSRMFYHASKFNQDIGGWDISRVTSLRETFYEAAAFNQPLLSWNTQSLISLSRAFCGATSFNQDISSWDTSGVIDMSYTFFAATGFNQPLAKWDVTKARTMSHMFDGAKSFNQDMSNWNTIAVQDLSFMFYSASAFNGDIRYWKTSEVQSMSHMFGSANAFVTSLAAWDVQRVTDMSYLFYQALSYSEQLCWDLNPEVDLEKAVAGTDGATISDISSPQCGAISTGDDNGTDDSEDSFDDSQIAWFASSGSAAVIIVAVMAYVFMKWRLVEGRIKREKQFLQEQEKVEAERRDVEEGDDDNENPLHQGLKVGEGDGEERLTQVATLLAFKPSGERRASAVVIDHNSFADDSQGGDQTPSLGKEGSGHDSDDDHDRGL